MFTKEQLAEILEVCEKAPLGPWKYEREEQSANAFGLNLVFETVVDANGVKILRSHDKWLAQFIAISRTALPQLAEEVIKLRAVAESAQSLLVHCVHCGYFRNGNVAYGIDEGEVGAERIIRNLEKALAAAGYGGEK